MELSPVYAVIDKVLSGETLRQALAGSGITPQNFGHMLQKDKAAAVAYARAAELRADLLADETIHLADGDGDPAKVRNQIQTRQWLAAKLNAKRYGDRIDLNVTQTIDVGSTLAEARARILQPVRDQLTHEQSQVVDVQVKIPQSVSSAPEQVSPAVAVPDEPDIFS